MLSHRHFFLAVRHCIEQRIALHYYVIHRSLLLARDRASELLSGIEENTMTILSHLLLRARFGVTARRLDPERLYTRSRDSRHNRATSRPPLRNNVLCFLFSYGISYMHRTANPTRKVTVTKLQTCNLLRRMPTRPRSCDVSTSRRLSRRLVAAVSCRVFLSCRPRILRVLLWRYDLTFDSVSLVEICRLSYSPQVSDFPRLFILRPCRLTALMS